MTRRRSVLLALGVLLGLPLAALGGYRLAGGRPLREVAREFLSYRRVLTHRQVILEASRESGVDPYLLAAIMAAESSGRVNVVSSKGALGLFQVSELTASWRAEKLGLPKPSREQLLSDPLLNARLGADNMAWLLETFDGDELRALCAYNAGTGRMKRLATEAGGWEAWRQRSERSGRSEILAYAQRVLRYRAAFRERAVFDEEVGAAPPSGAVGEDGHATPDGAT